MLSKTLLSPSFCAGLLVVAIVRPENVLGRGIVGIAVWSGVVIILTCLRELNRVYANQSSFLGRPPKLKWEDQIVLITGGGSGIGAHLADALASKNAAVVVLTKNAPEKENAHHMIHTYMCDVSRLAEVEAIALKVCEEVGNPTMLVNNAGVVKGKLLLDLTEGDVTDSFSANTMAHFWILKTFLPSMIRAGHGHVVSMSSVLGLVGAAQMTDYCATKAALISLHHTLRRELDTRYLAPSVRTTLVLPAFTSTSLFEKVRLPRSWFFNFLAPPLRPRQVVDAIIDSLESQENRVIRLPLYTNFARLMSPGVGIVPKWLEDLLQWVAGADTAMKDYGRHPDAAERLHSEIAGAKHRKSSVSAVEKVHDR